MLIRHGISSNIYLNDTLTLIQQGRATFEFHNNLLVAQRHYRLTILAYRVFNQFYAAEKQRAEQLLD